MLNTGSFFVAIPLSLNALNLIKWKDGEERNFHLVTRASRKWKRIGILLGYSMAELKTIECQEGGNDEICWFFLMEKWLLAGGSPSYPVNWEGLYKLLVDVEEFGTANLLKTAVTHAIPLPPPSGTTEQS